MWLIRMMKGVHCCQLEEGSQIVCLLLDKFGFALTIVEVCVLWERSARSRTIQP
jgi:hypothetical protein